MGAPTQEFGSLLPIPVGTTEAYIQLGFDQEISKKIKIEISGKMQWGLMLLVISSGKVFSFAEPQLPSFEECTQKDTYYKGTPLYKEKGKNMSGCHSLCLKAPQCNLWVLDTEGNCEILDEAPQPPEYMKNSTSGFPFCPPSRNCMCTGVSFVGESCDIAQKKPFNQIYAGSYQDCYSALITLSMKGCRYMTYRAPACKLFREVSQSVIKIDTTSISAATVCQPQDYCGSMLRMAIKGLGQSPLSDAEEIRVQTEKYPEVTVELLPAFKQKNATHPSFLIPGDNDGWAPDLKFNGILASEQIILIENNDVKGVPVSIREKERVRQENMKNFDVPSPIMFKPSTTHQTWQFGSPKFGLTSKFDPYSVISYRINFG